MSAALQAILEHPDFPECFAWWREEVGPEQAIIKEGDVTPIGFAGAERRRHFW